MQTAVYTINWTSLEGNLFGDTEGIDVAASLDRFYDMALDALVAELHTPINLDRQHASGSTGRPEFEVLPISDEDWNDDVQDAMAEQCEQIVSRIYEDGDWYVTE